MHSVKEKKNQANKKPEDFDSVIAGAYSIFCVWFLCQKIG